MLRRKSSGRNKLFACFFILLPAFGFQYGIQTLFGWPPDVVLGTLITFSFFLGFIEILFLGITGALLLNWQPQFSPEILMLAALPLLVFGVKKYFPWRIEISHLVSVFFALAVFYSISNYHSLLGNPVLFLESAGWTLVVAGFVFQLFSHVYGTKEIR